MANDGYASWERRVGQLGRRIARYIWPYLHSIFWHQEMGLLGIVIRRYIMSLAYFSRLATSKRPAKRKRISAMYFYSQNNKLVNGGSQKESIVLLCEYFKSVLSRYNCLDSHQTATRRRAYGRTARLPCLRRSQLSPRQITIPH